MTCKKTSSKILVRCILQVVHVSNPCSAKTYSLVEVVVYYVVYYGVVVKREAAFCDAHDDNNADDADKTKKTIRKLTNTFFFDYSFKTTVD